MSAVNFRRTYLLNETYESIKARAVNALGKYIGYADLYTFNDLDRSVTFSSERLIPVKPTNRPRILLLFSNPHPNSVHQGMFLASGVNKQESLFWPTMRAAGWILNTAGIRNPKQLAEIFLKGEYEGPFELLFYCYYAFPTHYPEHIRKIFGGEYFRQSIEPEAMDEFRKTVQETSIKAVVTFNKKIFNLVADTHIERYINRLLAGEVIESRIKGIKRNIPIFLTFPTGWIYHKEYKQYRKTSLERIKAVIGNGSITEEK